MSLLIVWAQLLIGFMPALYGAPLKKHKQHINQKKTSISIELKNALSTIYSCDEPTTFSDVFHRVMKKIEHNKTVLHDELAQICVEALVLIEDIVQEYQTDEMQKIYSVLMQSIERLGMQTTRAPRKPNPLVPVDPLAGPDTTFVIPRDVNIERDLNVDGDLTVDGNVLIPNFNASSITLTEDGGPACIIFKENDTIEKARICSSGIPGQKGVSVSIDGGANKQWQVDNSGDVIVDNNLFVNGIFEPNTLIVQSSATVNGPTSLQATTVNDNFNAKSSTYFDLGVPGVPAQILQVTKGDISGPNQFNSIKAAIDSITDASAAKPYIVQVGAGMFVEDTITMKPYVGVAGDSASATTVEVNATSKDVLIAAPSSSISNVRLQGATDSGKAAIVYSGGGSFQISNCGFGDNNIIVNEQATVGPTCELTMRACVIAGSATFERALNLEATSGIKGLMIVNNLFWTADNNPSLNEFAVFSGPNAEAFFITSRITSDTTLAGDGFVAQNGAFFSLETSEFGGFNRALYVPNVGTGPQIRVGSVSTANDTIDLQIDNQTTVATIEGVFDKDKIIIDDNVSNLSLSTLNPSTGGSISVGPQFWADQYKNVTDTSPQIEYGSNLGVISGGILSDAGGLNVSISSGTGYLMRTDNTLKYITWNTVPTLAIPINSEGFISINESGVAQFSTATPNPTQAIAIGKVRTNGSDITYIQLIKQEANHSATQIDNTLREALGSIYTAGSLTTKNGNTQLDVTSGRYFYSTHEFTPSGGSPITWRAFYRNGGAGGYTSFAQSNVDYQQYDNGGGALVAIPANNFARHALYIVNDGANEKYLLQYAQTTYTTLINAQNGVIPPKPGTWTGNITLIASIIVENTAVGADQIAEIRDERPTLGFKASGVSAVTDHGSLSGLLNDDHPQYLLTNGGRTVTGDLNMGTNDITNVGQVNGVTVESHAARHGANSILDPLPTAAPVNIGTTNQIGTSNSFARADHVHNHGNLTGGSLHADATTTTAGFMSSADKTKLNNINTGDFVQKTGDTMTGTLNINATGSNALVVNTNKLVIDNDTGNTSLDGTLDVTGQTTLSNLSTGVLHSNASGILTSSLVVDADIDPASNVAIGAQAANDATSVNIANRIVERDGSGNFSAGTITATLNGNASTATVSTNFSGSLSGDVTGTQGSTVVAAVGGQSAANVASATVAANNATSLNIADRIVERDSSGNFSANIITADLNGNATTATSAGSFTGNLVGDVTGPQAATVVSQVGGETAANVATATQEVQNATSASTPSTLVERDGSGNFSANTITANLNGNAATATVSTNFSGSLSGDVTGTQGSTVVSTVGGKTAAQVSTSVDDTLAATNLNTASTIVKRDGSGNFSAGTITANVTGSASENVLKAGDTMTGSLTLSGASTNLTVGGTTDIQDLTVHTTSYFDLGVPGIPAQTLQVTKGTLSGPNQFNSVKTAVDSITDASSTKPYIIQVAPGIYVEDTITMKQYVAVVGDSSSTTFMEVNATSKDVIIGAPNSSISNIKLRGATDTGKAAIVYNGGGTFQISNCGFGANDRIVNQIATTGPECNLVMRACVIDATSNFSRALNLEATSGVPGLAIVNNLFWIADNNLNLTEFAVFDGADAQAFFITSRITSATTLTGDGFVTENGALLSLQTSEFGGFAKALNVPNVGTGPELRVSSVFVTNNTVDVQLDNPNTNATIEGAFELGTIDPTDPFGTKVVIDNSITDLSLFMINTTSGETIAVGEQFAGDSAANVTNISPQIQEGSSLGVISGGELSAGAGLQVNVTAGTGYISNPVLKYLVWNAGSLALPANTDSYIYIDATGTLKSATSEPDEFTTILIGKARTDASSIVFVQLIKREAEHTATQLDDSWRLALGSIYNSGSLVSKNGTLQLDVSSGRYFFSTHEFNPSGGTAISWEAFYRNGSGNYTIVNQNTMDYNHYDDGSGTLALIPANNFARHALYIVNDGAAEKYLLVYAHQTYTTLVDAQNGVIPPEPGTWTGNITLIASIIVENTAVTTDRIAEIRDERPTLGFKASGVSVVTNHGDLSGLLADDHPQYLLVDGTRAMTGNLNMGGQSITNVNLVDGVDVPAHASRHLPNGADPLTTAAPVSIGTSNQEGVANSFARSDHIHNHGDLAGGTLHAVATTTTAGFMSAADKTTLDSINPANFVQKSGDTMTGTLNINATGSNALVVNTNKLIVDNDTGNTTIGGTLGVTGTTTLSSLGTGVVHSDVSGVLTSSLIVNADVDPAAGIVDTKLATISTAGKVANSATTATTTNNPNTIVLRDGSGDFSAGTITATLNGTATNFSGSLSGDVTGTQSATVVSTVGGKTAAQISTSVDDTLAATDANTPNTIVKRDGSGNFSAGTITANLNGNAATATVSTNFSGSLSGDVTGTQGATTVALVGGKTAAEVATAVTDVQNATDTNTPNTLVERDGSGNFSAGTITANLTGTATNATTAVNFSGPLAGDVSGTQGATVVDSVGGKTAAEIATSVNDTQAATALNTPNTIVKRDGSGNFSAGTISATFSGNLTGNVTGNLTGNVTGAASANVLKAGDTMSGALEMEDQQEVRLRELAINGTDYVAMRAPSALAASYTLTWPTNAGAASQVLSTDGAGNLSWVTAGGGGTPTTNAKMLAYVSTPLSLPGNTTVTVPFDTEVFDPNNNYNPLTYTYTVPITGYYLVCSHFSFDATASYSTRSLKVVANGTPLPGSELDFTEPSIPATLSTVEFLAAGDALTIEYTGRNGDTILANGANLSVHLLST